MQRRQIPIPWDQQVLGIPGCPTIAWTLPLPTRMPLGYIVRADDSWSLLTCKLKLHILLEPIRQDIHHRLWMSCNYWGYYWDDIYSLAAWVFSQIHLFTTADIWPYCLALLKTECQQVTYLMLQNVGLKIFLGAWYNELSSSVAIKPVCTQRWRVWNEACNINSCSRLFTVLCLDAVYSRLYLGHRELHFLAKVTLRFVWFLLSTASMKNSSASHCWKTSYFTWCEGSFKSLWETSIF